VAAFVVRPGASQATATGGGLLQRLKAFLKIS
jgi:hypothetical protein